MTRKMRMIQRPSAILAVCASVIVAANAFALPAFPDADGFGANAAGGRGGDVYHVTSLADNATTPQPGTLRYGLLTKNVPASGRTIVFDVGGTINLTDNLDVKNIHNVTIAGQTAPGHGITLSNYKLQVTSSSGL